MDKTRLFILYLCIGGLFHSCEVKQVSDVPQIILDTDFGPDYDDVGAVAFMHSAADSGDVKILGTVVSNKYHLAAPCLQLMNTYYKRPDLPIGSPKKDGANIGSWENWLDTIYVKYPHKLQSTEEFPDAVDIYRQILSAVKDKSVTIVTTGFFTNLSWLLRSLPDQYSPLSGEELVRKKVFRLVSMAGEFSTGFETNIKVDSRASKYVIEHWPTEIVFSGAELGRHVKTGIHLIQDSTIVNNPVKDVYALVMSRVERDRYGRSSYDQTAIMYAIYGCHSFFEEEKGLFITDDEGHNSWKKSTEGKHIRLILKSDSSVLATFIEKKMMHKPNNTSNEKY